MVYGTYDIIGTYAVDYLGNPLPSRRTWIGKYAGHSGAVVSIHSTLPGADSSDFQRFAHLHSNTEWFDREFGGQMIRIEQVMQYSYEYKMWYWTNTAHHAR